jgi:hypothetical protein
MNQVIAGDTAVELRKALLDQRRVIDPDTI